MKTIKQKLILFGILIISSPFVIGGLRLWSFTCPALLIFLPFLIYSFLPKIKPLLLKIILIISSILYALIFFVFFLRFLLCGYGAAQDEYVSRKNDNIKLVGRDFSCFETTGDLVLYKQFSISENIKLEIYYKTFADYKNINIDTTIWKPIQKY